MRRVLKKILIIMIVFTLLYSNGILTINAISNSVLTNAAETSEDQNHENDEVERIEIERNPICKNDMVGNKKQYSEEIKINLNGLESKMIKLSENANTFMDEETELEGTKIVYKETIIKKEDLLKLSLNEKIIVKDLNTEKILLEVGKSDLEEVAELEEGEVISEVAGDEEEKIAEIKAYKDYIKIEYISEIEKIEVIIKGIAQVNNEKEISVINIKEIDIIENEILERITSLKTKVLYEEFANESDNQNILQNEAEKITLVKNRETKAELGINVEKLSTTVENTAQFTITLSASNETFDLYKNPKFIIELPEVIENVGEVKDDEITILNNKKENGEEANEDIFSNLQINQYKVEGKECIEVSLKGEQTEYTLSNINDIQIIVPVKLKTSYLLPSLDSEVKLYYLNENCTSYNIASTKKNGYGEYTKGIRFVATTGIIRETTINVLGNSIKNYMDSDELLTIPSNPENIGTVKIVNINNTGSKLSNVSILGHSKLLGQISIGGANIKYSEDEYAKIDDESWTNEYTQNAKSYLITLPSFEQGQKIEYTYNINIPEVSKDTVFDIGYEILNSEGTKIAEANSKVKVTAIKNKNLSDIDVALTASVSKGSMPIEKVEVDSTLEYQINLKNKTDEIKNIELVAKLPDNVDKTSVSISVLKEDEETHFWIEEENVETENSESNIKINVSLNPKEEKYVNIYAVVDKFVEREVNANILVRCGEEEIELGDTKTAITPGKIEIEKNIYLNNVNGEKISGKKVKILPEDEIIYEIKIKNVGEADAYVEVYTNISNMLYVESIEYRSPRNEIIWDEENIINYFGINDEGLKQGEEAILIAKAKYNEDMTDSEDVISYVTVGDEQIEEERQTMNFKIELSKPVEPGENPGSQEEQGEGEVPGGNETPGDNDVPGNGGESGENEIPGNTENSVENDTSGDNETLEDNEVQDENETTKKYSISGLAWEDKDKDGERSTKEELLSGVIVELTKNDTVIKQTRTNKDGKYSFDEIEKGEYIIIFEYDKNRYKPTISDHNKIAEDVNSDAYEVSTENSNIVRTDKLSVTDNLNNIDIGLIPIEKFDLSIKKQINKITINNSEGTKVLNYDGEQFTKVEIPPKAYVGTTLLIEYKITVENNGEVPGYIESLADILPEGTKFVSEMNKEWYEENGKLYTIALLQQKIQPGEKKEITIVLTKEIDKDSAITITNNAEIIKTFNDELISEQDLTNNSSKAELIISVKTGYAKTYIILAIIVLSIISIGSYIIRKKVL